MVVGVLAINALAVMGGNANGFQIALHRLTPSDVRVVQFIALVVEDCGTELTTRFFLSAHPFFGLALGCIALNLLVERLLRLDGVHIITLHSLFRLLCRCCGLLRWR